MGNKESTPEAANATAAAAPAAAASADAGTKPEGVLDKVFTRKEVAELGKAGRQVLIMDNVVYDLETYAADHPGGVEVLAEFWGRDATSAFEDVGHSSSAKRVRPRWWQSR